MRVAQCRWANVVSRLAERGPTRHLGRLRIVVAIAPCLAAGVFGSAMAVAPTAASATTQNSAFGRGLPAAQGTHFRATQGSAGGAPIGDVELVSGTPTRNTDFKGPVTCLSVHGYAAVIGAVGTEVTAGYTYDPLLNPPPPPHPQSYLIVAVDNSRPTSGQFGETPGSPRDRFGYAATSATPDCSMGSSVPVSPLDGGDIVVRDAQDRPPRLSVPHGITITVQRRRAARVRYRVSATDDFDRHPVLRCNPRSGSRFAVGSTLVRCTARDRSGLTRSATFRVHVKFHGR